VKLSILDFDSHHDGYVLASAIGVSEGEVLYRDVFWQYGPLQPYFLASLIKALPFMSPLLVARLAGLVLVLLTFLVILLQPSFTKQKQNQVLEIKLITLILFLGLQDSYYGVPFLFWPNHLLILFLTLSMDQLIKQIQKPNKYKNSAFALQGTYLVFVVLSRPQFFPIAFVILLLIAIHLRSRGEAKRIKLLLVGLSAPLLIVGLLMTKYHVLGDFLEQTFTWPRAAYGSQLTADFFQISEEVVTNNLVLIALIVVLLADFFLKFSSPIWQKMLVFLLVLYFVFKINYGTFYIWTAANVNPARISILVLEVAILATLVLCGFYVLFSFFLTVFRRNVKHKSTILHWVVAVIAVLSLTQAFPVFDTRHTNWAILGLAPLPVVFLLGSQRRYQIVFVIFGLILTSYIYTETQRTSSSYETLTRVRGESGFVDGGIWTLVPNDSMSTSTRRSSSLGTEFQFLDSVFENDEQALFLSEDAAFSIFDGTYRSIDQWFVNWGPVPKLSTRISKEKFPMIIMDELSVSNSERDMVYAAGYECIDQFGRLSVFRLQESGE